MSSVAPSSTPPTAAPAPAAAKPYKKVRFADTAPAVPGAAAPASQVQLAPPAGFAGTLRPAPPYPRTAAIGSWLFSPDPTQRPWGISLQPAGTDRFVLLAPEQVGRGVPCQVRAQAVVGFGLGLGSKAALSVLALTLLLLPSDVLGHVPKAALAALTALAVGLAPRANFARHRVAVHTAALTPAELTQVAARRNGYGQWLLQTLNLDGLRALPTSLLAPSLAAVPELGEVVGQESAASHELGLGVVATLGALPGSWVRHSWLWHKSHAASLTVSRPTQETVRLQLGQVLAQPWRATFDDGLLWGSAHVGEGQQHVQITSLDLPATAEAIAAPLASLQVAFAAQTPPIPLPGAVTCAQMETVRSHGEGWRWPWALPVFKSFGVGEARQRFVLQQPDPFAAPTQLAVGVVGMNESARAGRVYWELRLRGYGHEPLADGPAARTEPFRPRPQTTAPHTGCVVTLQLYVPWLSAGRRTQLVDALGLAEFTASTQTLPQRGWRQDLFVHLQTQVQSRALHDATTAYAASNHDLLAGEELLEGARHRVAALLAQLRRAAHLPAELDENALDAPDEALLDVLAASGVGFFSLLQKNANQLDPVQVDAGYGQTQAILQDAAWHLAAWPAGSAKAAPCGWRRRAQKLAGALHQEHAALAACPFVAATPQQTRRATNAALSYLATRLETRLRLPSLAAGATDLPAPVTARDRPSLAAQVAGSSQAATHLSPQQAQAPRASSVLEWAQPREQPPVATERTALL